MAGQLKDFYKILQVDPSAEPEVISAAYKRLALKYHPDTNASPEAQRRMQDINEAYGVLGDPARRARYDRERAWSTSSPPQPQASQTPPRPGPEPPRPASGPVPQSPPTNSACLPRLFWIALPLVVIIIIFTSNSPSRPDSVPRSPAATRPSLAATNPAKSSTPRQGEGMLLPRGLHTATLLQDGRVLIVGGNTALDTDTASCEIYNPLSNTFTATGSLNTPRHGHSATLLADGRVLVVAGYSRKELWISSAEIYDSASGQWSVTEPLFAHGVSHTATLLPDGRVLVMAGSKQAGLSGADDRAELFDPRTNTWQKAAVHQHTDGGQSAVLLADGRVLVAGGRADPAIYDPQHDTWLPAGTLGVAQGEAQAVLLQDGRVLLVGGNSVVDGSVLNRVELYDPASNAWQPAAPLAEGREYHTATRLQDGRVLVVGGWKSLEGYEAALLNSTEVYDASKAAWSQGLPLGVWRSSHTATLLPDGRVLVTGGQTSRGVFLNSVELIGP